MNWKGVFEEMTRRLKLVVSDDDTAEEVEEHVITVFRDVVHEHLRQGPEWRCARRHPYRDPDCPGHENAKARQGHYFQARDEAHARRLMAVDFPGEEFDVEKWRET